MHLYDLPLLFALVGPRPLRGARRRGLRRRLLAAHRGPRADRPTRSATTRTTRWAASGRPTTSGSSSCSPSSGPRTRAAFGSIASTLAIPLFIAAVGIIFRGAAYALRAGASAATRAARDRHRFRALVGADPVRARRRCRRHRLRPRAGRQRRRRPGFELAQPDLDLRSGVLAVAIGRLSRGRVSLRRRRPARRRRPRAALPYARARLRDRRGSNRGRRAGRDRVTTHTRSTTVSSKGAA